MLNLPTDIIEHIKTFIYRLPNKRGVINKGRTDCMALKLCNKSLYLRTPCMANTVKYFFIKNMFNKNEQITASNVERMLPFLKDVFPYDSETLTRSNIARIALEVL